MSWLPTFLAASAAILISCATFAEGEAWNDLRVRFGMNPLTNFIQMPRTVAEAKQKGFRQETGCDGAANKFVGQRYVGGNGDRSIMLLFDKNGIIAGIQTQSPKSTGFPTSGNKKFHDMWVEEASANVLTAYFVDPTKICTVGRTEAQLASEGTGTGLYLQLGSATSNTNVRFESVPTQESGATGMKWSKGKCFVFMGQHYWYNMRQTMNCDDFRPYFLLYNSGKLDGFGFAMAANFQGEFHEHPTVTIAEQFFPFVPACMKESSYPQTLTTVHVYMYKRPWTKLCL